LTLVSNDQKVIAHELSSLPTPSSTGSTPPSPTYTHTLCPPSSSVSTSFCRVPLLHVGCTAAPRRHSPEMEGCKHLLDLSTTTNFADRWQESLRFSRVGDVDSQRAWVGFKRKSAVCCVRTEGVLRERHKKSGLEEALEMELVASMELRYLLEPGST